MILKIYQLKDLSKYGFMSYDYAQAHDFTLDDYEIVWQEIVDSDTSLDDVYYRFNVDHPVGYTGHSLSVSDVVELDGKQYYCDSFGWKEI